MKNFKISFDDVFLNGLTTFQVGCTVKYKCLCQQLGRKPDMKALKAVFTSRELKFVLDRFEVCSNFAQNMHEFVQNSPKFVQSLHEVCSKKDNQNNNITQKNENTPENFLNECCKKQESEQKEEKKNPPLNPQKENNKNIYIPMISSENKFSSEIMGVKTQNRFDLRPLNDIFSKFGLSQVSRLNEERTRKLKQRIAEVGSYENFIAEVEKALAKSSFLRGDNGRGWCANFDFFLQKSSWQKVLEGCYQDRSSRDDEEFWRKLEAM